MKNPIAEFLRILDEDGAMHAIGRSIRWIIRRPLSLIGLNWHDPIYRRQLHLAQKISSTLDSTVAYGPFRGLRLENKSWWAGSERGAILLGLYEQELLSTIIKCKCDKSVFVDVGAADGYYGVGFLVAGIFQKSHCFEANAKGQAMIRENASVNGVSANVVVHGIARKNFLDAIPEDEIEKALFLFDIEGAEFEILDESAFKILKNCPLFIEVHERFFDDGESKMQSLMKTASNTHSIRTLTTRARDLSTFPELDGFSDTDRWLLCSERRAWRMTWLWLEPNQTANIRCA